MSLVNMHSHIAELRTSLSAVLTTADAWNLLPDDEQTARIAEGERIVAEIEALETELAEGAKSAAAADRVQYAAMASARPVFTASADPLQLMTGGPVAMHRGSYAGNIPARHVTMRSPYEDEPGIGFSRFVKVAAQARGSHFEAMHIAQAQYGGDLQLQASLQQGSSSGGGFLVPDGASSDFIALLKNKTVIRKYARSVPVSGSLTMPTQSTGVTATWIGEGLDDNAQDFTFGARRLVGHKLRAMVPITNELLRNSSPSADTIVRDELVSSLSVAEDSAFIRSPGTGNSPKGIRYWIPTAGINNGVGTSAANIESDLIGMAQRLATNLKGHLRNPRWLMPSRSYFRLYGLRETNGNLVFGEVRNTEPMLLGMPVSVTDLIPVTLGSGSSGEIYLVDFADVVVADDLAITIATSDVAAYRDSTGTMQSAFSMDQTIVRAILSTDLILTRDEAAECLYGTNTTW